MMRNRANTQLLVSHSISQVVTLKAVTTEFNAWGNCQTTRVFMCIVKTNKIYHSDISAGKNSNYVVKHLKAHSFFVHVV
uniref:Uncharacterized protein n=1 Tax=Arion vulgaris TaxID=1028688 RepID=A0A0B7BCB0_9EUPU